MAGESKPTTKVPEIRSGDTVVVLHGKDAGKRGKVDRVIHGTGVAKTAGRWRGESGRALSVVIAGVNIAKRHTKPRQTMSQNSQTQIQQGGIVDKPMPIDASNVMSVCPRCDRVTVSSTSDSAAARASGCSHCREQWRQAR